MSGAGRKITVLGAVAALGGSMLVAVRRSAEVREIARDVAELEARAAEIRERRARAARAEDSLSSRRRILEVAAEIGFRVPSDSMVHYVTDVSMSGTGEGS